MDTDNEQWQSWMRQLADGDERVIGQFWDQYGIRLQRLAEKHLTVQMHRRVGPDDIVQSACRTFLRRAQMGQFELSDTESLWRLLCAITLTKIRQHVRFHKRQKRGVNMEQRLNVRVGETDGPRFELPGGEPTPEEAAEFGDELRQLLANLNEDERQVVQMKLEQYTNDEIAEQLGRSERTVRRIVTRVKSELTRRLEESAARP